MSSDYTSIPDYPGDNDYIPPLRPNPHMPSGWTIQSGGGIANMYMGGGGPYGFQSTRSDIYGESMPFLDIGLKDAVRGDMYDGTGLERMRPFTGEMYQQMIEPPYGNPMAGTVDYPYGYQVLYTGNSSPYVQPNATASMNAPMIENYEMIDSPDVSVKPDHESDKRARLHPLLVFFILVVLFLTIDIWIQLGNYFIRKYVIKDRKPGKWTYILLAVIATVLLWIVTYFSGISITWFERAQG